MALSLSKHMPAVEATYIEHLRHDPDYIYVVLSHMCRT